MEDFLQLQFTSEISVQSLLQSQVSKLVELLQSGIQHRVSSLTIQTFPSSCSPVNKITCNSRACTKPTYVRVKICLHVFRGPQKVGLQKMSKGRSVLLPASKQGQPYLIHYWGWLFKLFSKANSKLWKWACNSVKHHSLHLKLQPLESGWAPCDLCVAGGMWHAAKLLLRLDQKLLPVATGGERYSGLQLSERPSFYLRCLE